MKRRLSWRFVFIFTSQLKNIHYHQIEKIIRMHQELEINLEGVAVVLNLLVKISNMQNELKVAKNRLLLYES